MSCPINEILPNLFISDSITHKSNNFYKKFNIKYIVNCSKDLPGIDDALRRNNSIEYERLSINESEDEDNIKTFNRNIVGICRRMNHYLTSLSGVLIYCYSCNQCSPAVVAAYILQYCGIRDINLAVYYIRTKRPTCFLPIINYHESLKKLV